MKTALRSASKLTFALTASALALFLPALAEAQIKRPGAHPKYSVELEPHLVLEWGGHNGPGDDDGVGLGMRATIPFLDNGPISKINNNMGIGFGLDWAHNGDACKGWRFGNRFYDDQCTVDVFMLPVVVQWNFFLTPIVSVFGEAGLEIEHTRWEWDNCPWANNCKDTDTDVEPVFWGGGRFLFGANSNVGGVVRLGWPYISLGVGILL
ncbi:MAG: hypothetical protein IPI67_25770 [Myxococcales bacterium]|nr:hypothetical protein [Myxococcales bacterium]